MVEAEFRLMLMRNEWVAEGEDHPALSTNCRC